MSHHRLKHAAGQAAAAPRPAVHPLTLAIHLTLLGGALALGSGSPSAMAQSAAMASATRSYDIPAGPLGSVLTRFSREAGVFLVGAGNAAEGKTSAGLKGSYSVQAAFPALLTGTGLEAFLQADGSYGLRAARAAPSPAAPVSSPAESTLPAVRVTARSEPLPGEPSRPYAGGQVARGGRVGMLGEKDVFETPFNVTSFTSQAIADKQATKLADIARFDPSVTVASSSLMYSEDFLIRGLRVTQSSIGFDSMSGTIPNYGVGSLQAIERVEVFKGANTLLNGVVVGLTAGGYINLVPKRATQAPVTEATLGYASRSLSSTHADIGRRFGEDGQFGARLNLATQGGETGFENAHEKRRLAALALDYKGDKARLYLDTGDQVQDLRGAPLVMYPPASTALPAAPRSAGNYSQTWSKSDTQARYGHFKAEYDLAPGTMAYVAYGGHQSKYEQVFNYGEPTDSNGNFTEGFQNGRGRVNVHTVTAGLNSKFDTGPVAHQLSLSAVQTRSHYRFYYRPDSVSPGIPPVASNIYDPVRMAAPTGLYFRDYDDINPSSRERFDSVAIADTLSMFKGRLQLTGGLRHQRIDTIRYDYDGLGTVTGTYGKSALTPVVGAVFKATGAISIYGNYIESLDAGPTAPVGAVNSGEVFPPSRNKQYELGVKFDLGELALTTDVFDIRQPSGRLNPASLVYSVDGEQANRGIEFNVFGKLSRTVRLNGGVTFLDAKMNKTENGAYDGKRAQGTSRVNVAGTAEWDAAPGWTVIGAVRHTGAAYLDQNNTRRVAGYTLFDAGLRYKTSTVAKGLTIRGSVTNLADKAFFVTDPFGGIFQAAPREFKLTTTVAF